MLQFSKQTDEKREAGPLECWCLHGAVGMASDWRNLAKSLAASGIGTRAVDLWRFLECCPLPLAEFGKTLNAEVQGQASRGNLRVLLGYSMGGRLALHSLLEPDHPWQAAVIVSAHPGLAEPEMADRRAGDAVWATRALAGNWQEFLEAWNAQPVLGAGAIRATQESARLMTRRREIARSFVDWSLGAQQPLWDRLGEIQIPLLWVVGENDVKFRTLAERAVAHMPNASLAVLPHAGHRVPWQAEGDFARLVASFLKETSMGQSSGATAEKRRED